jgi:hypothetical protein
MRNARPIAIACAAVLVSVAPVAAQPPARAGAPPRGFSIPLVDLAADTARQVVVDREPGQYLGHPTTVLLEDGRTIVAVYPKGHGRGAIVMKRSTDGGRTWSGRLPTPANWETSMEVPTIYRTVDAKGTRRLIMFSGLYPIRLAVSEDDGLTWSGLAPIGNFGGIVAMASLVPLRTGAGHYMALFHDDGRFIAERAADGPRSIFAPAMSSAGAINVTDTIRKTTVSMTLMGRWTMGAPNAGRSVSPDNATSPALAARAAIWAAAHAATRTTTSAAAAVVHWNWLPKRSLSM